MEMITMNLKLDQPHELEIVEKNLDQSHEFQAFEDSRFNRRSEIPTQILLARYGRNILIRLKYSALYLCRLIKSDILIVLRSLSLK